MRNLFEIDQYRDRSQEVYRFFGDYGDHETGAFFVPSPRTGVILKIIASAGLEWDHVSVSLKNRCPNWPEMELVKRMFFKDDEIAMQLHVPPCDHISYHPYCLHLWRPQNIEIPRPPNALVGAPTSQNAQVFIKLARKSLPVWFIWILTSSESEKETWKAAFAVWFFATMIVIAGGW